MASPRVGRIWLACQFVLGLLIASISPAAAADDERDAKQRLEFMRQTVAGLEVQSSDLKAKALEVDATPLLRYSDPTRGGVGVKTEPLTNYLLDASVWRLGAEGRPRALVSAEIYQAPDGSRVMALEFISLTDKKFSLKHKTEEVRWDATESGLERKELPDAPKPATTAAARLTQMRQLARRFAVEERHNKERIECRLVAQPIDRYQSQTEEIGDGAIFAFANGTNPEIGILLESDGKRWHYGILRLSSAETTVTLDGKEVAAYERFAYLRRDGPYNGSTYKIGKEK
jgi:hypothetical protein